VSVSSFTAIRVTVMCVVVLLGK